MCKLVDRLEENGQIKLLASLINDGTLTLKQAAEKMSMTVAKFKATA